MLAASSSLCAFNASNSVSNLLTLSPYFVSNSVFLSFNCSLLWVKELTCEFKSFTTSLNPFTLSLSSELLSLAILNFSLKVSFSEFFSFNVLLILWILPNISALLRGETTCSSFSSTGASTSKLISFGSGTKSWLTASPLNWAIDISLVLGCSLVVFSKLGNLNQNR